MGSRYGGLKQVDPVGPSGEAILDYSVFDALRGGFGKVVFVIRRDFEAEFKEKIRTSRTSPRPTPSPQAARSRGAPRTRRVRRAASSTGRSP